MLRHQSDRPTQRAREALRKVSGQPASSQGSLPPPRLKLPRLPSLASTSLTSSPATSPEVKATQRRPTTKDSIQTLVKRLSETNKWWFPTNKVRLHITCKAYTLEDPQEHDVALTQQVSKIYKNSKSIADHVYAALNKYNYIECRNLRVTFLEEESLAENFTERRDVSVADAESPKDNNESDQEPTDLISASTTPPQEKTEDSPEKAADEVEDDKPLTPESTASPQEEVDDFMVNAANFLASSPNEDEKYDKALTPESTPSSLPHTSPHTKPEPTTANKLEERSWSRELSAHLEKEELPEVREDNKRAKEDTGFDLETKDDNNVTLKVTNWSFTGQAINNLIQHIEREVPWWRNSSVTISTTSSKNASGDDKLMAPRVVRISPNLSLRSNLSSELPTKEVSVMVLTFQKNTPMSAVKEVGLHEKDQEDTTQRESIIDNVSLAYPGEPEREPDDQGNSHDDDTHDTMQFSLEDDKHFDWGYLPGEKTDKEKQALENEDVMGALEQALDTTDLDPIDLPSIPANPIEKLKRLNEDQQKKVLEIAKRLLVTGFGRQRKRPKRRRGKTLRASFISKKVGDNKDDNDGNGSNNSNDGDDSNNSNDGNDSNDDNDSNDRNDAKNAKNDADGDKNKTKASGQIQTLSSLRLLDALASTTTPRIMGSARHSATYGQHARWQISKTTIDTYPEYVLTASRKVKTLWAYMLLVARHVVPAAAVDETNGQIVCWLYRDIQLPITQTKFIAHWLVRPLILSTLYTFCYGVARSPESTENNYESVLQALINFRTKIDGSTRPSMLQVTAGDYHKLNEQTITTGHDISWDRMLKQLQRHVGLESICEITNQTMTLTPKISSVRILDAKNLRFLFVWVLRVLVSNTLASVDFGESSTDGVSVLIRVSNASWDLVQEVKRYTPMVDVPLPIVADRVLSVPVNVEAPSRHQVRTIFAPSKFDA